MRVPLFWNRIRNKINLIADKMPKKETSVEEDKSSSANNNLDRKHDSGAADLEKVCSINPTVSIVSLLIF